MKVSKEARFAAGREAAVDGLGKAMKRIDTSSADRSRILSVLQYISTSDKSGKVRRAGKYALGKSPRRRQV